LYKTTIAERNYGEYVLQGNQILDSVTEQIDLDFIQEQTASL